MISGGHCCLYVGAAWPAPACRLFVHKVRAGELCQTIAWLSYYPHTIEPWDEAEFWGPWFWGPVGGVEGGWMGAGAVGWCSQPKSRGGGVVVVGTRAHPHWDHVAEQLDSPFTSQPGNY